MPGVRSASGGGGFASCWPKIPTGLELLNAVGRPRRCGAAGCPLHLGCGPLEYDLHHLALEFRTARQNRHRAGADRKLARLLQGGALRVAEIVQPIDQLPVGERLPAPQLERAGEDARQHRLTFAVQPGVDEPRLRLRVPRDRLKGAPLLRVVAVVAHEVVPRDRAVLGRARVERRHVVVFRQAVVVAQGVAAARWSPGTRTTWRIQFSGGLNPSIDATAFDLDMFDTSAGDVATRKRLDLDAWRRAYRRAVAPAGGQDASPCASAR